MTSLLLSATAAGMALGLSLIVAIGAQNAFVLRQALLGDHVGVVVTVCIVSDLALIGAGVAGAGAVLDTDPGWARAVRWAGAGFLLGYAALAARRAIRPGAQSLAGRPKQGLAAVVATALALTWLNPHVYLDTVVLLGSASHAFAPHFQWAFAAGAGVASAAWFVSLGFGARRLAPKLSSPRTWRVLDSGIAIVMTALATGLVLA